MSEFTRVSDIWKSFWQALEEEVLALGGRVEMLERLAKGDLRPAIRNLAWALIGSANPRSSRFPNAPITFDIQRAQGIWKSAVLWKNPDPSIPYCTFTFQNVQNQTKLIVGISNFSGCVQVDANLVTLNCPSLHQSEDEPHQRLAYVGLKAEVIGGIVYHEDQQSVEFVLTPVPGFNHRHLIIYDGGRIYFSEW